MRHITALAALALLAACGPQIPGRAPDPIVDPATIKDQAKYQTDLADCRQLSDQAGAVEGGAEGAGIGAVGGAALGAITGAVFHAPAAGAVLGGASGAAAGGTTGAMLNYMRQRMVLMNCVIGRGYRPLG